MRHPRTWYVITDGGRARFLHERDESDDLDTHREFVSANIHSRTHDLGADRPGRGHESANVAHHAVEPREDLHRSEKRTFVDEVAQALNQADVHGEFDHLVLVAPAYALTELDRALSPAASAKVAGRLQRDLTHVPNGELAEHFIGL
jgi:protein required for attachment to host cells